MIGMERELLRSEDARRELASSGLETIRQHHTCRHRAAQLMEIYGEITAMRMFVFGSSITSSYWNGAATYYRGIYKSLAALGHQITFAEPDIYQRQQNRDLSEVEYAQVIVYQTPRDIDELIGLASTADLVIKHSGVGSEDELLERRVLECRSPSGAGCLLGCGCSGDAATGGGRSRAIRSAAAFRNTILSLPTAAAPRWWSAIGGWERAAAIPFTTRSIRRRIIAKRPMRSLACDLVFVGNRLPDRERRVEQFFLRAAELAPEMRFVLGGEGWGGKALPPTCAGLGTWAPGRTTASTPRRRMVLNINRDSMADVGFSPPTRVFEAAGAATCLITDKWRGIEKFFEPGREILVAESAEEIVGYLRGTSAAQARAHGRCDAAAGAGRTYLRAACRRGGGDSARGTRGRVERGRNAAVA